MTEPVILFVCPEADRHSAQGNGWRELLPQISRRAWSVVDVAGVEESWPEDCAAMAFLANPDWSVGALQARAVETFRARWPGRPVFELHREWVSYAEVGSDWPGSRKIQEGQPISRVDS